MTFIPFNTESLLLARLPTAPDTAGAPATGQGTTAEGGQATTAENGTPLGPANSAPAPSPFGGSSFMFMLMGFFVLMILMTTMSGRKEKKRRNLMLESLNRHDRVMMSSGIIGTVVEVKDDEVLLKVDESNNTRIQFSKSAVQSVLKAASSPSQTSDELDELDEELVEAS